MLRPSKKLVLALEAVADIAYHGGAEPVQSQDIARRLCLPRRYLEQVMQQLVRAGILRGVRGPRGGYRLARTPERITLLDVVQAIDGTQPAFRCTEIRQRGPLALDARAYRRPCVINAAMLRAESAWRAELERTSLADIVSGVVATADPRVMARSARWLECNGRPAQRA